MHGPLGSDGSFVNIHVAFPQVFDRKLLSCLCNALNTTALTMQEPTTVAEGCLMTVSIVSHTDSNLTSFSKAEEPLPRVLNERETSP